MKTSLSTSFSRIKPLSTDMYSQIRDRLLETKFQQSRGYGFSNVDGVLDKVLSAILVKRSPTVIQQLDSETGKLEDAEIFVYSQVRFNVDFRYCTLDVFGPASNSSRVRTVFRSLIDPTTSVSALYLPPSHVVNVFDAAGVKASLDSLTVNNFRHNEYVVGRYSMRISSIGSSKEILAQYEHDVTKIHMRISDSSAGDFDLTVVSPGQLTVSASQDNIIEAYEYCKQVLFEEALWEE